MSRRRSDPRREEQDLKRLRRENDQLRKRIRKLGVSVVTTAATTAEDAEEVKEETTPGPTCPKCGEPTEVLDLSIRRYFQCTKTKSHRQRAA